MATFTKDVLYPGKYRLADGRRVAYTRADVRHLRQRLQDMVAAGLPIPAAWEHQDDAKPKTEEEREADRKAGRARHNLGFALSAAETPEGYLTTELDVPSDEDARRLPSVRFVSPEIIEDWIDGTGRLWPGKSITHIAVTARPVQHNQRPFQPVQMSNVVRLSLGDYMADEKPDRKKPAEGKTEEEEISEGGAASLKEVLEDLATFEPPIVLPEGTDESNFMDRLCTALKAIKGAQGGGLDDTDDITEDPGAMPVSMSLEARLKRAETKLVESEKAGLRSRIKALYASGRVGKPIQDKLLGKLGTARLSLDNEARIRPNTLLAQVEAYEELDAGATWPLGERLSQEQPQEVDLPAGSKGAPRNVQEASQQINDFFDMIPGGR